MIRRIPRQLSILVLSLFLAARAFSAEPVGITVNQSNASSLAWGAMPTGTSRANSSVVTSRIPLAVAQYHAT